MHTFIDLYIQHSTWSSEHIKISNQSTGLSGTYVKITKVP
jgi:hypothetical protein